MERIKFTTKRTPAQVEQYLIDYITTRPADEARDVWTLFNPLLTVLDTAARARVHKAIDVRMPAEKFQWRRAA